MEIAALGACAVLAVPIALGIAGPVAAKYRKDHGCVEMYGTWWGVPEFDSTWFCPADVNRMGDLGYVMRVTPVGQAAVRKAMEETAAKPEPPPQPRVQGAGFDQLLKNLQPEEPTVVEAKTKPPPAPTICGPDHWVKDHWEPSCH
jgi:hypothetical protein